MSNRIESFALSPFIALLGFALASSIALAPGALAGPADDDPPGGAKVIDSKEAKALLKAEKDALANREPRIRREALERLAKYSNEELVKTFNEALKDRDEGVVVTAIDALGNQPPKKATTALLRLLANKRYGQNDTYSVHVIGALGRVGWERKHYASLRKYYTDAEPRAKKELLRSFAAQKETQAFSLFVDNLDEPRPKDVNAANNPPAAYWKAKYKVWMLLKVEVRRGLKAVTGHEFKDAAEAQEWAKSREARKAGVRYKAGS